MKRVLFFFLKKNNNKKKFKRRKDKSYNYIVQVYYLFLISYMYSMCEIFISYYD